MRRHIRFVSLQTISAVFCLTLAKVDCWPLRNSRRCNRIRQQ